MSDVQYPGIDHGTLSGLPDDDHPQYSTDADLTTHEADTTAIHGISDTSDLATDVFNVYGSGEDGAITDAAPVGRSGILHCTTYTLDVGVALTVTKALFIFATTSITINGTINANEQGGAGGALIGGVSDADDAGGPGWAATNQLYVAGAAGGNGHAGFKGAGGVGGAAATSISNGCYNFITLPIEDIQAINSIYCAPGGSGGGAGGGGGGGSGTSGGGGAGGAGGGTVVLVAPSITISGTITSTGEDGDAGGNGGALTGAGGGGAGGSGGYILIYSPSLTEDTPTYTLTGGTGGAGGTGTYGPGDAGSNGTVGIITKLAGA